MNKLSKKLPKRLLTQVFFFLLQNPLLGNFISGTIYRGELKSICTPGLNCYSCPAAVTSCPLGAMQFFLAGMKQNISLFVTGFLLSIGIIFGRLICGFVCPMGLVQDLLYKIKTPKFKTRLKYARYLKYAVLALFVILLPLVIRHELTGLGDPWFCMYICPSGMIFGAVPLLAVNELYRSMAGTLFIWKSALTALILLTSVPVYRFFCRVLCPLGAIYALLNPIAIVKMRCDKEKCNSCGECREACNLKLDPASKPNSPECVRCGDCLKACVESCSTKTDEPKPNDTNDTKALSYSIK